MAKWPPLKARFPDIELHLVGPLQTNKLGDAMALFGVVHSLDREKLAMAYFGGARLPECCAKCGGKLSVQPVKVTR